MNRLENKHVLITGASEGLGRQLAIDFASEGAKALAIVSRRKEQLQQVKTEIESRFPGTFVLTIQADLSQLNEIERVVASTLNAFRGNLDVLINNASTLGPAPMPMLIDYALDDFQRVISTNLLAPFLLIQKAMPSLIMTSGKIINITSDAGITGYAGWGAYGISKFGLEGLSQTWSAELEDSGVKVSWVDPGNMNTKMHRMAEPDEDPSNWANPADLTELFIRIAAEPTDKFHGRRFKAQETETSSVA